MNPVNSKISEHIYASFIESGLSQDELAKSLGLSQSQVSRLLTGKSTWKHEHLRKFAELIKEPLAKIIDLAIDIHVSGIIGKDGFLYSNTYGRMQGEREVVIVPPDFQDIEDLYVLKIGEDNQFFRKGAVLYCRKNDGKSIKDGDFVVYIDDKGLGQLRRVFLGNSSIKLENVFNGEIVELPREHFRLLDRVVWVRL